MTPGIYKPRRWKWQFELTGWLVALVLLVFITRCGCAATATIKEAPAATQPTSTQPVEKNNSPDTDTKQAGNGVNSNVAGNTGFAYQSELSVGVVILLALVLFLSHRREMLRIAKNGHGGKP